MISKVRALAGMITVLFLANMLTSAYGQPADLTVNLLVDETVDFGSVTISYSDDYIHVIYTVEEPGWFLTEVHVDVEQNPASFPVTRSGNPKVGKFAYPYELTPPTCDELYGTISEGQTTYPVDVPWTAAFPVYIAAHAELLHWSWNLEDGCVYSDETGWGEGTQFSGHSWAMYIIFPPE